MAFRTLVAAAVLAGVTPVSAAPLVPIALVEDVKSATADVEFMDYVGTGQVIKLAPQRRPRSQLSQVLRARDHHRRHGDGRRGAQRRPGRQGRPRQGPLRRRQDAARRSQQANASAASAFRLQSADIRPTLYALRRWSNFPRPWQATTARCVIERSTGRASATRFKLDDSVAAGGFYDLAKANVSC